MLENEYKILRVSPDASSEELRAAYTKMVRRYPPEMFPERFAKVKDAYEALSLERGQLQKVVEEWKLSDNSGASSSISGFFRHLPLQKTKCPDTSSFFQQQAFIDTFDAAISSTAPNFELEK